MAQTTTTLASTNVNSTTTDQKSNDESRNTQEETNSMTTNQQLTNDMSSIVSSQNRDTQPEPLSPGMYGPERPPNAVTVPLYFRQSPYNDYENNVREAIGETRVVIIEEHHDDTQLLPTGRQSIFAYYDGDRKAEIRNNLQHKIAKKANKKAHAKLLSDYERWVRVQPNLSDRQQTTKVKRFVARLKSAGAPHAPRCLSVTQDNDPTCQQIKIRNGSFDSYLHLRLGIMPIGIGCDMERCPLCHKWMTHDHPLSCKEMKPERTMRHNIITNAMAQACAEANVCHQKEQAVFFSKASKLRPADLQAYFVDGVKDCDFTIVNPTAKSNLNKAYIVQGLTLVRFKA
jgi:hypothetical protein